MLSSNAVFADKVALDALVDAGVELTEDQKQKILNASDADLPAIISQVVNEIKATIFAKTEGNVDSKNAELESTVQQIVETIAIAKPVVVDNVATAISSSNPDLSAVVAVASVADEATAAGPNENANDVAEVAQEQQPGQNQENLPSQAGTPPGSNVVAQVPATGGAGGGAVSPN